MEAHLILPIVSLIGQLLFGDGERTEAEPTEPVGSVTINGEPAPDGIGTIGNIDNETVTDAMTFEVIRRGNNK